MMSELVKVDKQNGIFWITLNRPEVHNAFNDEVISTITKLFDEIDRDEKIKLVVITGEGKSFCAGADLNWMKSMKDYSQEENIEDSRKLACMFQKIDACKVPVIGKVNGHALGGGMGMLAVCDYVMAKEGGKFGFTELNLGLIPAVISPFCLKKIGISQARALFLSGEKFNAQKAMEINLVHQVFTSEEFEQKTQEMINHFAGLPAGALKAAKNLIEQITTLPSSEISEFTCLAIANQRVSSEGQEGMSALLEKRQPNWNRHD